MTEPDAAARRAVWKSLTRPGSPAGVFTTDAIAHLPHVAKRLLTSSLRPGVGLTATVILAMEGEIKLRSWMPFRARQCLRASEGFAWEATIGKPPLVFKGGDTHWRGEGSLNFKLWGLIPAVSATGTDIDCSSAGRLAAETVVWAPQALMPQHGAVWAPAEDNCAVVTLPVGGTSIDVTVRLDDEGMARELTMQRWGDPDPGHFGLYPFGGVVESHAEIDGVTIATSGRVGWWWGTDRQREGEFFRYRITDARFP